MVETVTKHNDTYRLRITVPREHGAARWLLVTSDDHFDSKECDRGWLKRIHEEANARRAVIFKLGDVFDAMGGKYDRRTVRSELRPEYQSSDSYFTDILRDAIKFYRKYNVAFVSLGNHEDSVRRRHDTNLAQELAAGLGATYGDYDGWITILPVRKDGEKPRDGSFTIRYSHGAGGYAPVTGGITQTGRTQASFPFADIYLSGHNHRQWLFSIPVEYPNSHGRLVYKKTYHLKLGTSKQRGPFARRKGLGVPAIGWWWIKIYYDATEQRYKLKPELTDD